jgi:hypothetical protein
MSTISIYNALTNSISLHTDVPVNDLMDNDPDLNFPSTAVTLVPGVTQRLWVRLGRVEPGSVAAYGFISDKLKGGFPDEFCHD